MKKYIPCGCHKCDFSEGQSTHFCQKGFCNSYEEAYFIDRNCECPGIGYDSLEEFDKAFGTHYASKLG